MGFNAVATKGVAKPPPMGSPIVLSVFQVIQPRCLGKRSECLHRPNRGAAIHWLCLRCCHLGTSSAPTTTVLVLIPFSAYLPCTMRGLAYPPHNEKLSPAWRQFSVRWSASHTTWARCWWLGRPTCVLDLSEVYISWPYGRLLWCETPPTTPEV